MTLINAEDKMNFCRGAGRRKQTKNLASNFCRGFLSSTAQEPSWDVSRELNAWASFGDEYSHQPHGTKHPHAAVTTHCLTTRHSTLCLTNHYFGEPRNSAFRPCVSRPRAVPPTGRVVLFLYSVVVLCVDCVPIILSKFQPAVVLLSGLIFTCPCSLSCCSRVAC